jgi:hypothetical protein
MWPSSCGTRFLQRAVSRFRRFLADWLESPRLRFSDTAYCQQALMYRSLSCLVRCYVAMSLHASRRAAAVKMNHFRPTAPTGSPSPSSKSDKF